jgi:oligoendopeptidase F
MVKKKETGGIPLREDIPAEHKWQLERMYPREEDWEADFRKVEEGLPRVGSHRGTLGRSARHLYECLELQDLLGVKVEKLYAYARMRRDEDNSQSYRQEQLDRALALTTRAGEALAFIKPELLGLQEQTLKAYLEAGELARYRHYLQDIARLRDHVLSEQEEELLSRAGEILEAPENVFSMLLMADLTFPAVKDEKGEEVTLTAGRFVPMLQSGERRVRQEAFTAMFATLEGFKNTFNASLSAAVKKNIFLSRSRRYPSSLEMYLDADHIPPRVYHNVVDTTNKNLAPLHRYTSLKKEALGLDQVHFYDLYTPLVQDGQEKKYPLKEAREMVIQALAPLGTEYTGMVQEAFDRGWIDVYENKGKTSGAYSFGTYESPPFILLNYKETLNDVFTLAHELGHSLHSYYSTREQPFVYSRYTIFSAEVASTTNEALLVRYLLNRVSPGERAMILNEYLEGIRGTFYRQTLFAEFELKIHSLAEGGVALTAEKLSSLWLELNRRYYGDSFAADPLLGMEWARIPHFYYNFYVYKYVTGFAAGTSLAKKILKEGAPARDRYINFLKQGSSGYSLDILKEAGVDMAEPAPLEDTVEVFSACLEEFNRTLG